MFWNKKKSNEVSINWERLTETAQLEQIKEESVSRSEGTAHIGAPGQENSLGFKILPEISVIEGSEMHSRREDAIQSGVNGSRRVLESRTVAGI